MMPTEEAIQRAKGCLARCEEHGFVCGGCEMQFHCGVLEANRLFLERLLDKIDPGGHIQRIAIGPLGQKGKGSG